MKRISTTLLVFTLLTMASAQLGAQNTEDDIMASIKVMFDGLAARDTAMMASVLDPGARLVQTGTRDGVPAYRTTDMADFLAAIHDPNGPPIREEIRDPQIVVHDNLATVWVSYTFYANDQVSHCGEDTFQLARRPTGWVIVAIADTQRREGCG